MLTLVINLERAADRREQIGARLNVLGVPFEFFKATDGTLLTPAERGLVDDHARHFYSRFPLSDNEIACGLSHIRAMRHMLDKGAPMAAILEDDAILTDDLPHVLRALEGHEKDFDFVFLHTPPKRGGKRPFVPLKKITPNNAIGRVKYMSMRTTGYVVSRKGAEEFLKQTQRFTHAVDMAMHRYWDNGLDLYALENPVAVHDDDAPSYINHGLSNKAASTRPPYPDADALHWQLARAGVKAVASVQKRLAFHSRLKSGSWR